MAGDYPRFKASYTHEELVEHFLWPCQLIARSYDQEMNTKMTASGRKS